MAKEPVGGGFCGDGGSMSLIVVEWGSRESLVRIDVHSPESRIQSPCDELPAPPWETLEMPVLRMPDGAEVLSSGMTGSSAHESISMADLRTDLSPGELLDHFGNQLRAEGWERLSESRGASAGIEIWRHEDPDGNERFGELFAMQLQAPSAIARVLFRVTEATVFE